MNDKILNEPAFIMPKKIFAVTLITIFIVSLSGCSGKTNKLPRPDHIVIVIEENHGLNQIRGNAEAPYINSLIKEGALFTNSHGVTHPSQPNYLALFSGGIQTVRDDHCLDNQPPFTTPNMGHELIERGYTFGGYSEYMPSTGFRGCGVGKSVFPHGSPVYARKHNPWVDWQGTQENGLPSSVNMPLSAFPSDFKKLPTVAIVVPDEDNDMHNGPDSLSIKRGDTWLQKHMNSYIQWSKTHNSLFIITFDEDNDTPANLIPTLFVGSMVKTVESDSLIDHTTILRTIEDMYSLPHAIPDDTKPISGIWK